MVAGGKWIQILDNSIVVVVVGWPGISTVALTSVQNVLTLTWPRNLMEIVLDVLRICFICNRCWPRLVAFLVFADVDTEGDNDHEGEDDDDAEDDDHHPVVTMA